MAIAEVAITHPKSIPISGNTDCIGELLMPISRKADSIGVNGIASATTGIIQGNDVVEKKVPAKKIMGSAMALPIPEAAEGLLVHADIMNPMFKNTRLPKSTIAISQMGLPVMSAPNAKIPTARIIIAWIIAKIRWDTISAAKNFHIGSGVTSIRLRTD